MLHLATCARAEKMLHLATCARAEKMLHLATCARAEKCCTLPPAQATNFAFDGHAPAFLNGINQAWIN
jgi:hypothetical protein